MKVVVSGLIAAYPLGGVAWDYLAYVRGLRDLGCDVLYLEDTGQWLYDPRKATFTADVSFHTRYLAQVLARGGPGARRQWSLRDPLGNYHGLSREQVLRFCDQADLFLNVSGACWLREEYRGARCIAYVDTDPGYTQAKLQAVEQGTASEDQHFSVGLIRAHHRFFTLATNLGQPTCSLPTGGLHWLPTRPPIVLAHWPRIYTPHARRYTTVMSWKIDVSPPVLNGQVYGGKDLEFARFLDLPRRVPVCFEVALSGTAPRAELRQHGWRITDGHRASRTLGFYRSFIQRSRAEWSVAKNVYVATQSGWFSTRTVSYLASGKPAIVQDTGFSRVFPTGEGLFAFSTADDVRSAVDQIERNYRRHCLAARALAEQEFQATTVLEALLRDCGLA
jgi:hypothetical protein